MAKVEIPVVLDMAESMINRIALLYKKAKSSAWGRTFKSDSERNFYIAEYLVNNDVVEVVRCKDCEYYETHKPSVTLNCERNGRLIPMMPDDFCSHGERKEVANNG